MQSSSFSSSEQYMVKSNCGMCSDMQCGINVYFEKGKIVKVEGTPEHPVSQGFVCLKARHAPDLVYSNDRLKYPMKKENGRWKQTSWEEALDAVATKLKETQEAYGDTSFGVFVGDSVGMAGRLGWDLIWRFCDIYGTPNRFLVESLCYNVRYVAHFATFGKCVMPDPEEARCIIIWGTNPENSSPITAKGVVNAMRKGAKLIVIDPMRIPLAKRADVHVQPRPGTDGALALAMLNTIISEGLYDKKFIEEWTVGFDRLADRVKRYPAEEVERITRIAAEDIKKIARMHATNKPACIIQGMNTLDQTTCGFQNSRAIAILQAITENIDIPGGWVRNSSGLAHMISARLPEKLAERSGSPRLIGADKYPLFHQVGDRVFGNAQMVNWADLVLTGKPYQLRTMIISGGNPVLTWPNSTKVKRALEKLDFLVVMDMVMSPTAEFADIVLPACTFMERTHLMYTSVWPAIIYRKPLIEPLWESWPDWKFWLELAKKMGYDEYFPWKDEEEALDYFLKPTGLTVEYLKEEYPSAITLGSKKYDEYKEKGIRTPSGKIELYSEILEKLGYDPLPDYQEPPESPITTPGIAKEYPIVLSTGTREKEFWHSEYHNLPGLRRRKPDPVAEIHPDSARKYGIIDGELMIVETRRGSIEIKAKVTEDIMPDVINIRHGWAQANENILTDDTPADPVSGYPALKALMCRIWRKT